MMTTLLNTHDLVEGQALPRLVRGPISRADLALFAGASGDHVPLHIDSDFAREAGMDDVFAHGMLSMAFLAQLLTGNFRAEQIIDWSVRFLAITPLHATVHCDGMVEAIAEEDGVRFAEIALRAATAQGLDTITGRAKIRLD